ncbi:MAG: hypothetical protein AB1566_13630 [Chloroflexota bacterium]
MSEVLQQGSDLWEDGTFVFAVLALKSYERQTVADNAILPSVVIAVDRVRGVLLDVKTISPNADTAGVEAQSLRNPDARYQAVLLPVCT